MGFELFQFIDPKYEGSWNFGPQLYTRTACYHIAITAPDPTALFQKLEKAGATKIGETVTLAQGQTILYLHDPFGLVIELCSAPFETFVVNT